MRSRAADLAAAIEGAVDRVEPDRDDLVAPIQRGQRPRGFLQRRALLGRRHRVLEVHEHRIGGRGRRLGDEPGAMRGNGEIGPRQPRSRHDHVSFRETEFAEDRIGCAARRRDAAHHGATAGNGESRQEAHHRPARRSHRLHAIAGMKLLVPQEGLDRIQLALAIAASSSSRSTSSLVIAQNAARYGPADRPCSACAADWCGSGDGRQRRHRPSTMRAQRSPFPVVLDAEEDRVAVADAERAIRRYRCVPGPGARQRPARASV